MHCAMSKQGEESGPLDRSEEGSGDEQRRLRAPARSMTTVRDRYRLSADGDKDMTTSLEDSGLDSARVGASWSTSKEEIPSGVASGLVEDQGQSLQGQSTRLQKESISPIRSSANRRRSSSASAEGKRRSTSNVVPGRKGIIETSEGREYEQRASHTTQARSYPEAAEGDYHERQGKVGSPFRRPDSRMSESESTSVASSSRPRLARSGESSIDDSLMRANPAEDAARLRDQPREASFYTWQNPHPREGPARLSSSVLKQDRSVDDVNAPSGSRRPLPSLRTNPERESEARSAPGSASFHFTRHERPGSPSLEQRPLLSARTERGPIAAFEDKTRRDFYQGREEKRRYDGDDDFARRQRQRSLSYDHSSISEDGPHLTAPHLGFPRHSPSIPASQLVPGASVTNPSLTGMPVAGTSSSKQQPSFVSKLYSMLEDESISDMISWGPSGVTFSVANPSDFAKAILPNWFKHSNWQSFVRQLNMYGFHKVNHTYQGTPEDEIQIWEFKHPSFRRGEIHMLGDIKRKSSRHKRQDSLTRRIVSGPDFEYSGSPSPEMGISQLRMHGPSGPSRAMAAYTSMPAPQSSSSDQARAFPSSSTSSYYRENPALDPSRQPQRLQSQSVLSQSQPQQGYIPDSLGIRLDDVSDRIDAVIRHASFYEDEMRAAKEQIYALQQNESSLRAHVHHLEAQMRSLSDQLNIQQQSPYHHHSHTRLVPPPPPSQSQVQQPSSQTRQSEGIAPLAPPPNPSAGGGGSTYGTRSPSAVQHGFPGMRERALPQLGASRASASVSADSFQRPAVRPSSTGSSTGPGAESVVSRNPHSSSSTVYQPQGKQ